MTDYYIDPVSGSDGNSGTSPGSGNAWQTLANADDYTGIGISGSDHIYIKNNGTVILDPGGGLNHVGGATFTGYSSTIADGGKATIQLTSGLGVDGAIRGSVRLENIILDANGNASTSNGVSAGPFVLINCTIQGFGLSGVSLSGNSLTMIGTIVKSCNAGGGTAAIYNSSANPVNHIIGCKIFSNSLKGIQAGSSTAITSSQIYGNGTIGAYNPGTILGCTIHGNGSDGIFNPILIVMNNVITSNGGYGINHNVAGIDLLKDYNFLGSGGLANTSGAYGTMSAGPHDLSGNPSYANAGSADFTPGNPSMRAALPSGWIGAVQPGASNVPASPVRSNSWHYIG